MDTKDLGWLGQHLGVPAALIILFVLLMMKYILPKLLDIVVGHMKVTAEANERILKNENESNERNIKNLIENSEGELSRARMEHRESLRQVTENSERLLNKLAEHNLQVQQLYAGRIEGVVTELREFKDEISQRIQEVTINFRKL